MEMMKAVARFHRVQLTGVPIVPAEKYAKLEAFMTSKTSSTQPTSLTLCHDDEGRSTGTVVLYYDSLARATLAAEMFDGWVLDRDHTTRAVLLDNE